MDINYIYILIGILVLVITYLFGRLHAKQKPQEIPTDLITLYKQAADLPTKVLQTIQGSINPQKGKVAELLAYAQLRYDYDRIIPLGSPIDFVGIKNNERIDFIEVKNGNFATLTEEEKHIKNLVVTGRVHFRLIKISDEDAHKYISAQEE
ncbi:MAG: Holliday junction resolvase-like protein [Candidatus Daviesbacteria bacterium]|nr:Holliday junction resolvase-like protein [Candidatus Daviesbacteria bacterium]